MASPIPIQDKPINDNVLLFPPPPPPTPTAVPPFRSEERRVPFPSTAISLAHISFWQLMIWNSFEDIVSRRRRRANREDIVEVGEEIH